MDPKACWQRIVDAANVGDWDEAALAANDLYQWLMRGGSRDGLPPLFTIDLLGFEQVCRAINLRKKEMTNATDATH